MSDLQAAFSYLFDMPYVSAVGMVGVCTSAGNAACLATIEPRLKALATVAAFLPSPALYATMFGEAGLAQRKDASIASRRKYESTGEVDFVPAYSETDESAVNYRPVPGSYDYYLSESRGNVPEYRNEAAVMGLAEFLEFDPLSRASAITTPTMVVHSDGSAFPDEARRLYDEVRGEKEIVWAEGNHFDFYDSPEQIDHAVANVARFFRKALGT